MNGTRTNERAPRRGMSLGVTRSIEYVIVLASVAALALIFQPFSLELFSVGAGLIVLVGLLFNLVPLAQPGRPLGGVAKGFVVIAVTFVIITALALGAAWGYGKLFTGLPPA